MPKRSKGYSKSRFCQKGTWYGRLRVRQLNGKYKDYSRVAMNKTDARVVADKLEEIYIAGGVESLDASNLTFADLIAHFKQKKVIDPVYLGERKMAGYKGKDRMERLLKRLLDYFGSTALSKVNQLPTIEEYKLHLIRTPTRYGRERSAYDINHLLRALRLLLNYAKANKWIMDTPFGPGSGLINTEDEVPRIRPELPGELDSFLEHCAGRRLHVRYWTITIVETAARTSEIDRITREDLDFEKRLIRLRVSVTKTQRERLVPMTALLEKSLREWLEIVETDPYWKRRVPLDQAARIFGAAESNRTAFESACRTAQITNLRRQDLRHWGTTRLTEALAKAGISHKHGMKITGHSQDKTYARYLITDEQVVQNVGAALDRLRESKSPLLEDASGQIPEPG